MSRQQAAGNLPIETRRVATIGARDDQLLLDKLKSLPQRLRAQVEDFIDFLRGRADVQLLAHVARHAPSEPAHSSTIL